MSQDNESPSGLLEGEPEGEGIGLPLSLHEISASSGRTALRAPRLVCYGVVEGEKKVWVDGEETHAVRPGGILVVPPLQGVVAQVPDTRPSPTRYVSLRVDRSQTRRLVDQTLEGDNGTDPSELWQLREQKVCLVEDHEGVQRALEMIAYLFRENPPTRDQLLELNARQLVLHLLRTHSRPLLLGEFSRHSASGGLAAAVQYIHDNLDRHISINELVDEACMSKSSFYRHFNDEFDLSPLEYITHKRIERARSLLADPENTVTSVGHQLGFSSTSYFIETFKEQEGRTPKQYQLDEAHA